MSNDNKNPLIEHDPKEWKISPLSNLVETKHGLWTGEKDPLLRVRVIRNTNFNNDGSLDLRDVAELKVQTAHFATRKLSKGDIILERSGGGPTQPVGRVVYFHLDETDYSFSNFTTRLRVLNKSEIEPQFLFYYLLYFYKKGRTNALQSRTTGIRNLNFKDYLQIPIPLPPLPEQRAIAHILTTVRQSIEATERVIAAGRELKRSLMKYLFTYGPVPIDQAEQVVLKETEVGYVPEDWTVCTLDDVKADEKGAIVSGPFGSNIGKRFFVESGVPLIRGNNLTKGDDFYKDGGYVYITETKAKELASCTALPDDLIYTAAGTIGQVGIIPRNSHYPKYVISNKQLRARIDISKVRPDLLFYWFTSSRLQKEFQKRRRGTSIPVINLGILRNLPVAYPTYGEQTYITDILHAVDNKLRTEVQLKTALEASFHSLLHHLMTGKLRVDPSNFQP